MRVNQAGIVGVSSFGCCYGISIMSEKILSQYGRYGALTLLENIRPDNYYLTNFYFAASNTFREPLMRSRIKFTTMVELLNYQTYGDSWSGMLLTNGHSMVLGYKERKFYLIDPNTGFYSYDSLTQTLEGVDTVIDKYYGYIESGGENLVGFQQDISFSLPRKGIDLLNNKIVLVDSSFNEMLSSFTNEYIVKPLVYKDANYGERVSSYHGQPLILKSEFYSYINRPVFEFSELLEAALDNLEAVGISGIEGVADVAVEYEVKRLLYTQFSKAYVEYVDNNSRGRSPPLSESARFSIARALNRWGSELIPGNKSMVAGSGAGDISIYIHNRKNTEKYMLDHDLYFKNLIAEEQSPEALLIFNVSPDQLAKFYSELNSIMKEPNLSQVIHSVKTSSLSRYNSSAEPIIFYLKSRGWAMAKLVKDVLINKGFLSKGSYWESDYPAALSLGQGAYYYEIPKKTAELVMSEDYMLNEHEEMSLKFITYGNMLGYIFTEAMHDYIIEKEAGSGFKLPELIAQQSDDYFRLLSSFLGAVSNAGFDYKNFSLVKNKILNWKRSEVEFENRLSQFNAVLLADVNKEYLGFIEGSSGINTEMAKAYISQLMESKISEDRVDFFAGIREGHGEIASSIRMFNNIHKSYVISNNAFIELSSAQLGMTQIVKDISSSMIYKDFKSLSGNAEVYPVSQNILASCTGGSCLSLTRLAAVAFDKKLQDGLEELIGNVEHVSVGDKHYRSFLQSLVLMQESSDVGLQIREAEKRFIGLQSLEGVFSELDTNPIGKAYQYILETPNHTFLLGRVNGSDYVEGQYEGRLFCVFGY